MIPDCRLKHASSREQAPETGWEIGELELAGATAGKIARPVVDGERAGVHIDTAAIVCRCVTHECAARQGNNPGIYPETSRSIGGRIPGQRAADQLERAGDYDRAAVIAAIVPSQ